MSSDRATQRLARQITEAADLEGFLSANRHKFAPETVASLKEEVDRLGEVDLTKAEPLARATRDLALLLDDPVSKGYGDAAVARVHYLAGRSAEAEPLYRAAIDRMRAAGRRVEAAALERQLVGVLMDLGQAEEGLAVARRARRTLARAGERRLLAQLETVTGNLHYYLRERYRTALVYLERARANFEELGDDRSLAFVEYNRANAFSDLDMPHQALELYERAERLLLKEGLSRAAAQVSYTAAFTLAVLGRYSDALRRYYATRERARELGDPVNMACAGLYLAELNFRLNILDEASDLADSVLAEFSGLGYEQEVGRTHVIRARIAERRRDPERALEEFARAEAVFDRLAMPVLAAGVRLARADLLLAGGSAEEAAELAAEAAALYGRARLPGKRSQAQLVLCGALRLKGETGAALRLARRVARTAARVGDPLLECKAEELVGSLEIERRRRAEGAAALERAIAGIERLRLHLRPGEMRATFLGDKLSAYEKLVELNLERGDVDGLRAAFRYVEMAKSRALADLMGQYFEAKRGERAPGREAQLREQLARRLEELSWYSSRVDRESEKGDQRNTRLDAHLRSEMVRCERDLAGLFRRLEVEDANLAGLFATQPPGLDELAAEVAPDEALVEFFSVGDRISAFVITREGPVAIPGLAQRHEVERHLAGLRFQLEKFSLGQRYAETHRGALRRCVDDYLEALHGDLIAPLAGALEGRRLIFVPHGSLHYVPMHALKGPDGRYLIEHHEVSYCPSATVFQLCSRRSEPASTATDVLAVGLSDDRTPHIVEELATIGRLFEGAEVLRDERADKAAFLSRAPSSRYLHLATHGYFRRDNPMFSSVRLADGPLSFYDVFDLDLDAELVTLSACNTGINDLAPGDELCGLMRGFLYAGASSLVVSLWAVNDRSTSDIMQRFYGHLRNGASKRSALRLAELEALEQYGHPYYWAPFILMGKA